MCISTVTLENRSFIKNQNILLPYDPAVLLLSMQQKESKSDNTRNTCAPVPTQLLTALIIGSAQVPISA